MTRILVNTRLIAFTVFSSTVTLILVMLIIEKILEPHIKNASNKELAVLGLLFWYCLVSMCTCSENIGNETPMRFDKQQYGNFSSFIK